MYRTATAALLAVLAFSVELGVNAQAASGASPEARASASHGRVLVRSGGVGSDEATLFKQDASLYPLRVVFSAPGGEYAVPDQFTILHNGTIVSQTPSSGPWHLIDLPPGQYLLQARFADRVLQRAVSVGAKASPGNTVQWVVPAPM